MDNDKNMSGLLARLKVLDPSLWEELEGECELVNIRPNEYKEYTTCAKRIVDDILQGCIQRAIAARGWGLCQGFAIKEPGCDFMPYAYIGKLVDPGCDFMPYAYIGKLVDPRQFKAARSWGKQSYGNSPAAAILAAYLSELEG